MVGAGLLGSATARALAARGVPAVALEQFGAGHNRGSSLRNISQTRYGATAAGSGCAA